MPNKQVLSDSKVSEYSFAFSYLLAGAILLVAVFLFLPRILVG